jgi:hypothetical protein
MTQLTENLTVWELWYFKAVTSYRGELFQVPTRLTTVTRHTGEYKVDLTRHPKFPLSWRAVVSHTASVFYYKKLMPLTDLYFPMILKTFQCQMAGTSQPCSLDVFKWLMESVNVLILPRHLNSCHVTSSIIVSICQPQEALAH